MSDKTRLGDEHEREEAREILKERRLVREAKERKLGAILVGTESVEDVTDVAIVEVTYGTEREDGSLAESAGFYEVFVKDNGGGEHPANVASDAVYEHLEGTFDYVSVDDVYPR